MAVGGSSLPEFLCKASPLASLRFTFLELCGKLKTGEGQGIRKVRSIAKILVTKSQEAALAAVQTFNNPLITFRAEIFIVLMHIAWTYLLHAHYRGKDVDYRRPNRRGGRGKFERTRGGGYVYWGLRECLNSADSPLDKDTGNNLSFLIELRNEIEHRATPRLDDALGAKFQACCVNYKHYLEKLFAKSWLTHGFLDFSLQFSSIDQDQVRSAPPGGKLPKNMYKFVQDFESKLSEEEFDNPRYSYRILFVPKTANRKGQADRAIEFIKADSPLAASVNKEYVTIKETDREKYLPGQIVEMMKDEGFSRFNMHHHTELWKSLKARTRDKGYGVRVAGKNWYWYKRWVDEVRKHCRENAEIYRRKPRPRLRRRP